MNILELTKNPLFLQWAVDMDADRYPQADGTEKLDCCSFELTASYASADDMHSLQVQVTNIDVTLKGDEIFYIDAPFHLEQNTLVTIIGLHDDIGVIGSFFLSEMDDMGLPDDAKSVINKLSNILYPMASDWNTVKTLHREQW